MKPIIGDSATLLRKGKVAAQASDVAFIETNDTIIRFFFSRQEAIQTGDRELVFRFQMGTDVVEAKFDLKEMVYRGGPAL